jgi:hypothetical protein
MFKHAATVGLLKMEMNTSGISLTFIKGIFIWAINILSTLADKAFLHVYHESEPGNKVQSLLTWANEVRLYQEYKG